MLNDFVSLINSFSILKLCWYLGKYCLLNFFVVVRKLVVNSLSIKATWFNEKDTKSTIEKPRFYLGTLSLNNWMASHQALTLTFVIHKLSNYGASLGEQRGFKRKQSLNLNNSKIIPLIKIWKSEGKRSLLGKKKKKNLLLNMLSLRIMVKHLIGNV